MVASLHTYLPDFLQFCKEILWLYKKVLGGGGKEEARAVATRFKISAFGRFSSARFAQELHKPWSRGTQPGSWTTGRPPRPRASNLTFHWRPLLRLNWVTDLTSTGTWRGCGGRQDLFPRLTWRSLPGARSHFILRSQCQTHWPTSPAPTTELYERFLPLWDANRRLLEEKPCLLLETKPRLLWLAGIASSALSTQEMPRPKNSSSDWNEQLPHNLDSDQSTNSVLVTISPTGMNHKNIFGSLR